MATAAAPPASPNLGFFPDLDVSVVKMTGMRRKRRCLGLRSDCILNMKGVAPSTDEKRIARAATALSADAQAALDGLVDAIVPGRAVAARLAALRALREDVVSSTLQQSSAEAGPPPGYITTKWLRYAQVRGVTVEGPHGTSLRLLMAGQHDLVYESPLAVLLAFEICRRRDAWVRAECCGRSVPLASIGCTSTASVRASPVLRAVADPASTTTLTTGPRRAPGVLHDDASASTTSQDTLATAPGLPVTAHATQSTATSSAVQLPAPLHSLIRSLDAMDRVAIAVSRVLSDPSTPEGAARRRFLRERLPSLVAAGVAVAPSRSPVLSSAKSQLSSGAVAAHVDTADVAGVSPAAGDVPFAGGCAGSADSAAAGIASSSSNTTMGAVAPALTSSVDLPRNGGTDADRPPRPRSLTSSTSGLTSAPPQPAVGRSAPPPAVASGGSSGPSLISRIVSRLAGSSTPRASTQSPTSSAVLPSQVISGSVTGPVRRQAARGAASASATPIAVVETTAITTASAVAETAAMRNSDGSLTAMRNSDGSLTVARHVQPDSLKSVDGGAADGRRARASSATSLTVDCDGLDGGADGPDAEGGVASLDASQALEPAGRSLRGDSILSLDDGAVGASAAGDGGLNESAAANDVTAILEGESAMFSGSSGGTARGGAFGRDVARAPMSSGVGAAAAPIGLVSQAGSGAIATPAEAARNGVDRYAGVAPPVTIRGFRESGQRAAVADPGSIPAVAALHSLSRGLLAYLLAKRPADLCRAADGVLSSSRAVTVQAAARSAGDATPPAWLRSTVARAVRHSLWGAPEVSGPLRVVVAAACAAPLAEAAARLRITTAAATAPPPPPPPLAALSSDVWNAALAALRSMDGVISATAGDAAAETASKNGTTAPRAPSPLQLRSAVPLAPLPAVAPAAAAVPAAAALHPSAASMLDALCAALAVLRDGLAHSVRPQPSALTNGDPPVTHVLLSGDDVLGSLVRLLPSASLRAPLLTAALLAAAAAGAEEEDGGSESAYYATAFGAAVAYYVV